MRPCTCELFNGDPHFVLRAMVLDVQYLIHGPKSPQGKRAIDEARNMAEGTIDNAITEAAEAGHIDEKYIDGWDEDQSMLSFSPWAPAHALGINGSFCYAAWVADGSLDWTSIEIRERLRILETEGKTHCVQHFAAQITEQIATTEASEG